MDGCVLDEKPTSKIMGFSFSSRLNWCSHIDAIAKTASIEALSCFMKFLSSEVALYFHRSVIRPCIDYSCHIWAGAWNFYMGMLDKLQQRVFRTVGPTVATSHEPLVQGRNIASLNPFSRCYFAWWSYEPADLVPLPYSRERSTRFPNWLHSFLI